MKRKDELALSIACLRTSGIDQPFGSTALVRALNAREHCAFLPDYPPLPNGRVTHVPATSFQKAKKILAALAKKQLLIADRNPDGNMVYWINPDPPPEPVVQPKVKKTKPPKVREKFGAASNYAVEGAWTWNWLKSVGFRFSPGGKEGGVFYIGHGHGKNLSVHIENWRLSKPCWTFAWKSFQNLVTKDDVITACRFLQIPLELSDSGLTEEVKVG